MLLSKFGWGKIQYPAPTWQLTTICNSRSRGSDAFFWPPRVPGTDMYAGKILIHKKFLKSKTPLYLVKKNKPVYTFGLFMSVNNKTPQKNCLLKKTKSFFFNIMSKQRLEFREWIL